MKHAQAQTLWNRLTQGKGSIQFNNNNMIVCGKGCRSEAYRTPNRPVEELNFSFFNHPRGDDRSVLTLDGIVRHPPGVSFLLPSCYGEGRTMGG